ncbi:hypothetical protein [Neorhodopirellula pilleata]|nr:hypothetical protein [Neorhodopirellula pilleata]
MAIKFDGVKERSFSYPVAADYEHEHRDAEHEHETWPQLGRARKHGLPCFANEESIVRPR